MQEVPTIGIKAKSMHDVSDPDIDDAQEALVLLLEFLLIKDLNSQNAIFIDSAARL